MSTKNEKYFYNTITLRYEKLKVDWKKRALNIIMLICAFLVFSTIIVLISHKFFPSPNEKKLLEQIDFLEKEQAKINNDVDNIITDLFTLRERDATIYRSIYQRDPLPENIWKVGLVDSSFLNKLSQYDMEGMMGAIVRKIENIKQKLATQLVSYDEINVLIERKNEMLSSIPSIQPVANKNLKYIASGFGMRIHPIYRVLKMHTGIDFTAPMGTVVYATGDGNIETAGNVESGYGNQIVINHGYGYKTRYAHLSVISCHRGKSVKRGEIIGKVGNTGSSVGPHLHYEVEYNDSKVNPALFFFNDLSDKQYEEMLRISSAEGQQFEAY